MKPVWENPEIQQENRLPMRSPLIPYPSVEQATNEVALGPEALSSPKSKYIRSLDGTWLFKLLSSPTEIKEEGEWTSPSFDASSWSHITVPGSWTVNRRQGMFTGQGVTEYNECVEIGNEIKRVVDGMRNEIRQEIQAAAAPKTAVTCPWCGATTVPDASGCCEYCGGSVQG